MSQTMFGSVIVHGGNGQEPPTQPVPKQKEEAPPPKVTRKRKRITISCTECHRRKQKCDRGLPCANCKQRNKDNDCQYANPAARTAQLAEDSTKNGAGEALPFKVLKLANQVSEFGYSKVNGDNNTTMGVFNKIQSHDPGFTVDPMITLPLQSVDNTSIRDKYRTFIRLLPVKPIVDKLLETYFDECNTHYYPLDEGTFRELYVKWQNISHATLSKGPQELPLDLQHFPALLFQVLALALQFQPPEYDPSLDALKYLSGMSFDDVASEYSDSSLSIINLLGVRCNTLLKVQASFLRASFLKNCGMIPEAWHALSSTIRHAQDIGLHKPTSRHHKTNQSPEDVLEGLWHEQLRIRMWCILCIWDIHMASVLGRPTTIDQRDGRPTMPMDTPIPKSRRQVAPTPRDEHDPPTPLSMLLWNAELAAPLWSISGLEKEDPHQNNLDKVEMMHSQILSISLHCPPWFRSENPDTTFDSHSHCQWLPRARPVFQNAAAFSIMALHRPYIFTSPLSRTRALHAALDILKAQRRLFYLIDSKDYKTFSLVLNTFDAIVLLAATFILHPLENRNVLDCSLQHFEWGMERFDKMGERNNMAKSALGVLKAIYVRLKRALDRAKSNVKTVPEVSLGTSGSTPSLSTAVSVSSVARPFPPPYSYNFSHESPQEIVSNASSTPNGTVCTQPTISNLTENNNTPVSASWENFTGNILDALPRDTTYNQYNLPSMAPLQPMHDLLSGLSTGGSTGQVIDPQLMEYADSVALGAWQFEGPVGPESFWGFMNSYGLS
ncbi:fungal-specific transcription factor domain-containing protein [Calycina marina]|uniref:Fungal-specific transcription factor domain-containing protein n=1 Tax=Calycina marina TaxID=1763456 RepID=A0A9P8CF47_9HELO|nr:fungal-specific transcription factor domain-containing protein [Calycina marina]